MNNSQSINMLINNEMGAATNRNQAHLLPQAHHLQHQQVHPQQQQQTQPLNADQRQVALADLFNSLSNLANNQQQLTLNNNLHQHQHHHHQQHQQQQHLQPPPIPPPTSIALTNSIQSAMAATLLRQQQQLASRIRPPQVSQPQQLQHQVTQQQSHSPFFAASEQAHLFNGVLEQDVQSTSGQQQSMAQQQQSHQRINYCTICNKELCNKYFMKTHMLKMHGINLEMEQPDESNEADEQGDGDEDRACSGSEQVDEEDEAYAAGDEDDDREHHQQQQPKSSTSEQGWSPVAKKPPQSSTGVKRAAKRSGSSLVKKQSTSKGATSVLNGFAGNSMGGVVCDICNKELCSKYFLKVHKQNTHGITDYQDPGQFMYPFANPIAAPNPFMVPAAIATPNLVGSPTFPSMNPLSMFSNTQQQQTAAEDCSLVGKRSGGLKKLRLNQSKPHQVVGASLLDIEKANQQPVDATNRVHSKQIENFYRLIIAQQQQQQQQPPQPAPLPAAPAHQPLLPMADPMSAAANPLRALMCFGVMNPAGSLGPTGMSPAMIVDSILRNQHLFSRNHSGNVGASPAKTSAGGSGNNKSKDVNNNSNEPTSNKKHSNENKTSKDSNSNSSSSSRYFSHYTEACPMCDRRFKSIKWLKTHMMNDHKQEIGAYMQMMMQYLYASKSQQMAAATMAAFEQQQHHNLAHHLSNQSHAMQFQQPVNVNNTAKTFQSSHFGTNQNPFNTALSLATDSASRRNSEFCTSSGEQMMPEVANDYVIDARRERLDSLSPSTGISLRSPASPSTSRLLAFVQDNPATTPASALSGTAAATTCGLNFELERLRKGRPMKAEPSLLSGGLLLNDEDDEDENGGQEGDVSREVDDYSGTGDDNSNTDCGHAEEESRCSGADKGGQQQQLLQSTIEIKTTSS